MNSVDLLLEMGKIGWRFRRQDVLPMMEYFDAMIKENRVVMISKNDSMIAMLAFSMCDNYEPFLKKKDWDFLNHDPNGNIMYVEKLVSLYWDKEVRKRFEEIITKVYPRIEYAVWHRFAKWGDRKVIYKRRIQNVRN